MCEFCFQHGEGKIWYMNMANYSRELCASKEGEKYISHFLEHFEVLRIYEDMLNNISNIGWLSRLVYRVCSLHQRVNHFGQVVPIEDAEAIIDMQDSIVKLPCACKRLITGEMDRRCIGMGIDALGVLGSLPDYSFEQLNRAEAKAYLRDCDENRLVHSIWTFKTPFIAGICNCDENCMAYRLQIRSQAMELYFKAEYIASIDWELCNGCGDCADVCQFSAVMHIQFNSKAAIIAENCYGCGLCRAQCPTEAISLLPREKYDIGATFGAGNRG